MGLNSPARTSLEGVLTLDGDAQHGNQHVAYMIYCTAVYRLVYPSHLLAKPSLSAL